MQINLRIIILYQFSWVTKSVSPACQTIRVMKNLKMSKSQSVIAKETLIRPGAAILIKEIIIKI